MDMKQTFFIEKEGVMEYNCLANMQCLQKEFPSFVFLPVIVKFLTLIKSLREYSGQSFRAFLFSIQWKNTDQYLMIHMLFGLHRGLWLDNLRPDLL